MCEKGIIVNMQIQTAATTYIPNKGTASHRRRSIIYNLSDRINIRLPCIICLLLFSPRDTGLCSTMFSSSADEIRMRTRQSRFLSCPRHYLGLGWWAIQCCNNHDNHTGTPSGILSMHSHTHLLTPTLPHSHAGANTSRSINASTETTIGLINFNSQLTLKL